MDHLLADPAALKRHLDAVSAHAAAAARANAMAALTAAAGGPAAPPMSAHAVYRAGPYPVGAGGQFSAPAMHYGGLNQQVPMPSAPAARPSSLTERLYGGAPMARPAMMQQASYQVHQGMLRAPPSEAWAPPDAEYAWLMGSQLPAMAAPYAPPAPVYASYPRAPAPPPQMQYMPRAAAVAPPMLVAKPVAARPPPPVAAPAARAAAPRGAAGKRRRSDPSPRAAPRKTIRISTAPAAQPPAPLKPVPLPGNAPQFRRRVVDPAEARRLAWDAALRAQTSAQLARDALADSTTPRAMNARSSTEEALGEPLPDDPLQDVDGLELPAVTSRPASPTSVFSLFPPPVPCSSSRTAASATSTLGTALVSLHETSAGPAQVSTRWRDADDISLGATSFGSGQGSGVVRPVRLLSNETRDDTEASGVGMSAAQSKSGLLDVDTSDSDGPAGDGGYPGPLPDAMRRTVSVGTHACNTSECVPTAGSVSSGSRSSSALPIFGMVGANMSVPLRPASGKSSIVSDGSGGGAVV